MDLGHAIAGAALALAACGEPVRWHGKAPVPIRADIASLKVWPALNFMNREAGYALVVDAYDGQEAIEIHWDASLTIGGCAHAADGFEIRVNPTSGAPTVAHEIGHMLGLDHDYEYQSIMRDTGCAFLERDCIVPDWQLGEIARWYR